MVTLKAVEHEKALDAGKEEEEALQDSKEEGVLNKDVKEAAALQDGNEEEALQDDKEALQDDKEVAAQGGPPGRRGGNGVNKDGEEAATLDGEKKAPEHNPNVIAVIATRLPTKAAYRCTVLSKPINCIINAPLFLKHHLAPRAPSADADGFFLQPAESAGYSHPTLVDPFGRRISDLVVRPDGDATEEYNIPSIEKGMATPTFFDRTVRDLDVHFIASHDRRAQLQDLPRVQSRRGPVDQPAAPRQRVALPQPQHDGGAAVRSRSGIRPQLHYARRRSDREHGRRGGDLLVH